MGHKAAETAPNINNTFGPVAANERAVQSFGKKFAKEMRALKMRSIEAGQWKLAATS